MIHEVVGLEDDTDQASPRDKVIDEQRASGELAGRIVDVVGVELAPSGQDGEEDGRA